MTVLLLESVAIYKNSNGEKDAMQQNALGEDFIRGKRTQYKERGRGRPKQKQQKRRGKREKHIETERKTERQRQRKHRERNRQTQRNKERQIGEKWTGHLK